MEGTVVKLELPIRTYKRIYKIIQSYEKGRAQSRIHGREVYSKKSREINDKLKEVGLEKLLRKSKKTTSEPIIPPLNIYDFVINKNPEWDYNITNSNSPSKDEISD